MQLLESFYWADPRLFQAFDQVDRSRRGERGDIPLFIGLNLPKSIQRSLSENPLVIPPTRLLYIASHNAHSNGRSSCYAVSALVVRCLVLDGRVARVVLVLVGYTRSAREQMFWGRLGSSALCEKVRTGCHGGRGRVDTVEDDETWKLLSVRFFDHPSRLPYGPIAPISALVLFSRRL